VGTPSQVPAEERSVGKIDFSPEMACFDEFLVAFFPAIAIKMLNFPPEMVISGILKMYSNVLCSFGRDLTYCIAITGSTFYCTVMQAI